MIPGLERTWIAGDHADVHHIQIGQQRSKVPQQGVDKPRPVSALERQLLVVDDDRCHRTISLAPALWPASGCAASWPLTTPLSIVPGNPVSVQSPARKKPRTGVSAGGLGGASGASENVARASRTTSDRKQWLPGHPAGMQFAFGEGRQVLIALTQQASAPLATRNRRRVRIVQKTTMANTQ